MYNLDVVYLRQSPDTHFFQQLLTCKSYREQKVFGSYILVVNIGIYQVELT